MQSFECPACKHKFTDLHENWNGIVFTESCPNPNCGMPFPDNFLSVFRCQNCNTRKPISEVGHMIFAAKLITAFATPRMRKVCKKCSPQVNIFGLVMLALILFIGVAFLFHA